MRLVGFLLALIAIAALPDSPSRHRGIGQVRRSRSAPVLLAGSPPYDAVYGIATHNSYWIDRSWFSERGASGTQERILDQLLHENVRALELDVHFNSKRPGVWSVYHTNNLQNTFCKTLNDCLRQIQLFQYLEPQHDVVNIIIELKELWGHVFDEAHTIEQFDALLRQSLGDALYTPRDFAARCPSASTLRDCARRVGWPSIDALRGKFIVNVLGNFNYNANDWVRYATADGGVSERAAFPMRSILDESGDGCTGVVADGVHDAFDPDALAKARAASIFWQVEQLDYADIDRFLDDHGIVRGHSSASYAEQLDRLRRGFQLIQTDHPWHFVSNKADSSASAMSCRLQDPASVLGNQPSFASSTRVETGSRLQVKAQSDDKLFVASEAVDEMASEWETLPSTTRSDSTSRWSFDWSRLRFDREDFAAHSRAGGMGCLRAATQDAAQSFMICSQNVEGEHKRISVHLRHAAKSESPEVAFTDVGDLMRLRVLTKDGRSCVSASAAGAIEAGAPVWRPLVTACFTRVLAEQGIAATRDVLFVGTRHNGASVAADALSIRSAGGLAMNLSAVAR